MDNQPLYSRNEVSECAKLDQEIKRNADRVAILLDRKAKNKGVLSDVGDRLELALKQTTVANLEMRFVNMNCRNKIEYQRLLDAAILSTEYAVKQEQEILSQNRKEQNVYIAIAAIVLVTGLVILTKE